MEDLKKRDDSGGSFSAMGLAFQLGYLIVIPLVLFAVGGRLLDKKLHSSPFLLLAGILVSIFISSFIVYTKTKQVMADIERAAGSAKQDEKEA